jgi:hypothetical protein
MDVIRFDRCENGLLAETWIQDPTMDPIVAQLP